MLRYIWGYFGYFSYLGIWSYVFRVVLDYLAKCSFGLKIIMAFTADDKYKSGLNYELRSTGIIS